MGTIYGYDWSNTSDCTTWYSGTISYTATPDTRVYVPVEEPAEPGPESALDWLDRRVDEVRVSL